MALEIEKKEKIPSVSADIIFLMLALFFLFGFLASYFYFLFSEIKIKKEISAIELNIKDIEKKIEPLEKEAQAYREKVNNFKILLGLYYLPSKIFEFLENSTHPEVFYHSLDFSLDNNYLKLPGTAKNLETLAQQIIIFKNNEFIKNINLSKINLGKGGEVNFDFELYLDPKLYKKQ